MMKLLGAAAALCVISVAASAQEGPVPNSQARKTALAFSDCLVKQSGRAWQLQLLKPYGGAGTNTMIDKLLRSNCLNGRGKDDMAPVLKFPRPVFRAVMFDALYRQSFGTAAPVTDFSNVPALVYAVAEDVNEETARPYLVSMALGDCVARRDPAGARALLVTEVESADETAALQALVPAFQACVPEGAELKLTRWKARGTLAEPLFRLTQATQVKP